MISNAHEGLNAAVAKVFHAPWQTCWVHFMRNAMVHVGKGQRSIVAALLDALREAILAQQVVHADEIPVQMLAPGEKKTHRAYVWAYCTTPFCALKAVVYDFSPSRAGEHARNFYLERQAGVR